jgi:hypothetical protein
VAQSFPPAIPTTCPLCDNRGRFRRPVSAGLRWGMYPERLAATALADGAVVRISIAYLDVLLFWQCWKLDDPIIICAIPCGYRIRHKNEKNASAISMRILQTCR